MANEKSTNERIIVSAKMETAAVVVSLLVIVIGIVTSATCLMWETILGDWAIFAFAIIGVAIVVIGAIMLSSSRGSGLYVTANRVYGKTLMGKRVDIPLDSVSSISLTFILFRGVSVASSSGVISFYYIADRDKIYNVVSDLLIERQKNKTSVYNEKKNDGADELKKYKELFDQGVISQEEFDAKKKQLLGL